MDGPIRTLSVRITEDTVEPNDGDAQTPLIEIEGAVVQDVPGLLTKIQDAVTFHSVGDPTTPT